MADLTADEQRIAEDLIERLESDEVQARLKPGFERDFSNSILEQWERTRWLSTKPKGQLYWLGEIVNRYPSKQRRVG